MTVTSDHQKPRRVLISAGEMGRGGIRTHLELLCGALRQSGADVTIAAKASRWPHSAIDALRAIGVRFVMPPRWITAWRPLSTAWAMGLFRIALPDDLASVYWIGPGRMHGYIKGRVDSTTPSVYHEVVYPEGPTSPEARCAREADAAVASSQPVADMMKQVAPGQPIRVIPFLTSDKPQPPPEARPPVGDRELRVVYLGRLVGHKRPDRLVKQWRDLTAQPPLAPARLDVYGYDHDPNGTMVEDLRRHVEEHELGHCVTVHGAYTVEQTPAILAQADVVVLPSEMEGLPLVLVEAMSHGVPIVATDAGGTAELGQNNPDAIITSIDWDDFVQGLTTMAARLRSGQIDAVRLHGWTESRYGYETVADLWRQALLEPRDFFVL